MAKVTAIKTGTIRIRPSHHAGNMDHSMWRRRLTILLDKGWTEPLPIYTYLVEHADGLILFDTGETARHSEPGYFPWWHPYFQRACDIHVDPDDEVGPRLRTLGIDPGRDLDRLVISHLHHDHADGLSHFEGTQIVVSDENYRASRGLRGKIIGAVPQQWPSWFDPALLRFDGPAVSSFEASSPITADGTVFAVPTPGHMPGHLSLVVRTPEVTYFLAGDATYNMETFTRRVVDGPSADISVGLATLNRIAEFARHEPTVLLPAHDPFAEDRLAERITLTDDIP